MHMKLAHPRQEIGVVSVARAVRFAHRRNMILLSSSELRLAQLNWLRLSNKISYHSAILLNSALGKAALQSTGEEILELGRSRPSC